jgi:multiple sugar transport system permease protein
MPEEIVIIPQFVLFKTLNWLNTFLPLIVPSYFGGGAFTIFLLRQFFITLPRDLDEAAKIDGAGTLRVLWQILIPLSQPVLATIVILSFIQHWNDFFRPLIYLNEKQLFTVSLGLSYFEQIRTNGGGVPLIHLLMAASIVVTVPIIVVFFALQRYFIRGIVMTGIKG